MIALHRAERADLLASALADLLSVPPADPFAADVVAVPTRGVERWLSQRLAARLGAAAGAADGVCANVEFPFPGRLLGAAVNAATGGDAEHDPWRAERMVWPLLEIMEERRDDPALALLVDHLDTAGRDEAGRFASLRAAADRFDHYAVHRPEMLLRWAAGDDGDVAPDLSWQAHLWRLLRARLGTESPAERLPRAVSLLREHPARVDLPERLALFGLTRLPASHLDVLDALGAHRDVHLFLLHPSPALWERVAPHAGAGRPRRIQDPTARLPRNPLLASWGRDAREMQSVLATRQGTDRHLPLDEAPASLLAHLQSGVRADAAPPGPPAAGGDDRRIVLAPGDRSVELHACHGRARQVEVVRDAVLHALAADPSLEPRDIVVMCPAIDEVAPLVRAAFERGGDVPGTPDLHVRLADRSLRQTNPVLGVVARLLELIPARMTASEVLDLAARDPVRRRFHMDDDDLARLDGWARESGVRWGLDGAHREPYGLGDVGANTWRSGLDRLLAGVAMAEEAGRLIGGVLPLDDVATGDVDLAGRAAELLDRLGHAQGRLSRPQPVAAWADAIARSADELCAVAPRDAWQREELAHVLDAVVDESRGSAVALGPGEVLELLSARLRGRPTRANFRTGHLTVCTLVPMRSVPHRMVCLLGLDDGAFPRAAARDGDDILAHDPLVGDRDARAEDRQLLLDALMAAGERLVVAHTAFDERTNAPVAPAVPVGELTDVIDATAVAPDGGRASAAVTVRHPLQPFDPRNFIPGALARRAPWSFDPAALGGAVAMAGPRAPRPPFLDGPLPAADAPVVDLDLLARFVRRPVGTFLRRRLGISPHREEERDGEDIPVALESLDRWSIGQRLLRADHEGADAVAARRAELARGTLPPGPLGSAVLSEVEHAASDVRGVAARLRGEDAPRSHPVEVALPDGRVLVGTVPGVTAAGRVVIDTFSKLGPHPRMVAWIHLLALTAADPAREWSAAAVGRSRTTAKNRIGVSVAHFEPLGGDAAERGARATRALAELVGLLDRGMCEPLPLFLKTSHAFAQAARAGRGRELDAAASAWESGWNRPGEDQDPEHVLVFGRGVTLEHLMAERPRDDESGEGWDMLTDSRFGRLAMRLWTPQMAHERMETL